MVNICSRKGRNRPNVNLKLTKMVDQNKVKSKIKIWKKKQKTK